jgi:hypothetical protein
LAEYNPPSPTSLRQDPHADANVSPGLGTIEDGNIYVTNGLTSSNRFFRLAY